LPAAVGRIGASPAPRARASRWRSPGGLASAASPPGRSAPYGPVRGTGLPGPTTPVEASTSRRSPTESERL
jgi:hypothetical protein